MWPPSAPPSGQGSDSGHVLARPFRDRRRQEAIDCPSPRQADLSCKRTLRLCPSGRLHARNHRTPHPRIGRNTALWRSLDLKPTFHSESQKAPELSAQLQLAVRWANRFFSHHLRLISGDDTRVERLRTTSRRWWQPIPVNAMPQTSSKGDLRGVRGLHFGE